MASQPVKTIRLLLFSIKSKSLIDFAVSLSMLEGINKYDINHICSSGGDRKTFIGNYLKELTNIPHTTTVHGSALHINPNWELFKISLLNCNNVITVSNHNKKLIWEFLKKPINVDVVRSFVEVDDEVYSLERYEALSKLNENTELSLSLKKSLKKKIPVILSVGGFFERKGYDNLLEALSKIDKSKFHSVIAGFDRGIPEESFVDLDNLKIKYNLEENVTIFRNAPNIVVELLLKLCDFFVLPCKTGKNGDKEGLPSAILEAMAYGKAVVSTKHTGIPESLPEILVKENDSMSLKVAINKYIADEDKRQLDGIKNKRLVDKFNTKDNVKSIFNIIKNTNKL